MPLLFCYIFSNISKFSPYNYTAKFPLRMSFLLPSLEALLEWPEMHVGCVALQACGGVAQWDNGRLGHCELRAMQLIDH